MCRENRAPNERTATTMVKASSTIFKNCVSGVTASISAALWSCPCAIQTIAATHPKQAVVPTITARLAKFFRRTIAKSKTSAANANTITISSGTSGIIQSKRRVHGKPPLQSGWKRRRMERRRNQIQQQTGPQADEDGGSQQHKRAGPFGNGNGFNPDGGGLAHRSRRKTP
jgi:hypothetical protein